MSDPVTRETPDEACELPEGWVKSTVGGVFSFRGGGTPNKKDAQFWNGEIPWASVKDVKGTHLRSTQDRITTRGLQSSATSMAHKGDLIVVTRISPGLSVISEIESAINQDLKVTTPPEGMSTIFCHYLFETIRKTIIERSSGTTVLGIRAAELAQIEFPLPPLNEQKRIVAKIEELFSELDAGIESIKQARAQLWGRVSPFFN